MQADIFIEQSVFPPDGISWYLLPKCDESIRGKLFALNNLQLLDIYDMSKLAFLIGGRADQPYLSKSFWTESDHPLIGNEI